MRRPRVFKCPHCGNKVTVYVLLSEPPVCNNPVHIKGGRVMVLVEKTKEGEQGAESCSP